MSTEVVKGDSSGQWTREQCKERLTTHIRAAQVDKVILFDVTVYLTPA